MEDLYQEIAEKIRQGELDGRKVATIHTQVLLHADHLKNIDTKEFCRRVGIDEVYSVEVNKMRNVAKELKRLGYTLEIK